MKPEDSAASTLWHVVKLRRKSPVFQGVKERTVFVMAFTRKALAGLGLEKEQIEKVMALHGTSMSGFIPKSQLQARIGAAVEHALQTAPVPDIAESEEYKRLQSDFNAYRRRSESVEILRKAGVKEKFLEAVLALLDCEKPVPGQLSAIRRQYEEYFITGSLSGEDAHFPYRGRLRSHGKAPGIQPVRRQRRPSVPRKFSRIPVIPAEAGARVRLSQRRFSRRDGLPGNICRKTPAQLHNLLSKGMNET